MIDKIELQKFIDGGASFLELVDYLSSRSDRPFTPFEFLRILQEELDIPFVESRYMLEYFDPQMKPISQTSVINELGQPLLRRGG